MSCATEADRTHALDVATQMAGEGLRVLAFAEIEIPKVILWRSNSQREETA